MSLSDTFKVFALLAFLFVGMLNCGYSQQSISPLSVKNDEARTGISESAAPIIHKKADFKNFPTVNYPSNTAFLYKETPEEYQRHPEFGTIPYMMLNRTEMVELIQKRTEKTRYFVNANDPKKFTIHQSYGNLHYRDENGWWRTIDPRLRPSEREVNVFQASSQPYPTKIDLNKGFTSITLKNKFELKFNQSVKMYAVFEDGRKELITIINVTPEQTSVGKDGAYSKNILTGLDREVLFEEGKIKTNFILNQALPSLSHLKDEKVKYISFEEELNLNTDLRIEPDGNAIFSNGYISGNLFLKDKSGKILAEWEKPLIYDQNDYVDGLYLIRKEGKKTLLTFAIDASWLLNEARQYPIIIDPTLRERTTYDNLVKFKNNTTGQCWGEYCEEETETGYRMGAVLPSQAQISTVYFDIVVNIDSRVIFTSPVREANYAFAFAGPCNRSPEDDNFFWTCGRRTVTNATTRYECATRDAEGNPILYPMENAGTCIDPVCTPSTVDFFLQTTGCNCGVTNGCSADCYSVQPQKWVMYVDGETIQPKVSSNVGANDTTYVCSGEMLRYSAGAQYGVPPYKYRWEEKTTGQTSATSDFTMSGLEEGKMYDVNLFYSDACNNEKTERYIIYVRKGPELSFVVDTPSCPNVADGKITSIVDFANPAITQPTSSGCPLSKQDEVPIVKASNLFNGSRTPYRGSKLNSRMLFVVRADEIKAANPEVANGGKLTSIAFFVGVNRVLSKGAYENFTIKIGTTNVNRLRTQDIANYRTKTVLGPVDMRVNAGWNVHQFSTGFVWDGTSNLIFDICHNNRFSIQGNDEVELHDSDIATNAPLQNVTIFMNNNVNKDKLMCDNSTGADYSLSEQRPNFKLSFCQGYELLPNQVLNKTGVFDQLKAGEYKVLFVDPSGCSYEREIDIPANRMSAKVSKCPDDDGFIFAEVTGGRPPYQYRFVLTDATFKDDNRTVYAAHNVNQQYQLIVSDRNGCLDTFRYDFQRQNDYGQEFTQQTRQVSCFGKKDARYQILPDGGVDPVNVRVYRAGNNQDTLKSTNDGFGTFTFDSLGAGTYRYVISDADLCKREGVFTITEPLPLEYTVTLVEPAYCNEKRAVIRVDFVNGTRDYTLKVDYPDNTTQTFTTGNTFYLLEELAPGNYFFTVSDAGRCDGIPRAGSGNPVNIPIYTNFPVIDFASTPSDPSCPNTEDGIIHVNVTNGVAPYQYRILRDDVVLVPSTSLTGNNLLLDDLTAGRYFIEITDSHGCKDTLQHELLSAEPFIITKGLEQTVCINQAIQLGDPADKPTPGLWKCDTCGIGFFSDDVNGVVNPNRIAEGMDYSVYYEAKGCRQPVMLRVRRTNAGNDAVVCDNNLSFTPVGFSPSGGTWSAPQIPNIDPVTGEVALNKTLGAGIYEIIYQANVGGSVICPDTLRLTVKAEPKPETANRQFCIPKTGFSGTVDLSQGGDSPQGGIWIAEQPELITNENSGTFDIGLTNGWGTYNVYYVYDGCSSLVRVRLGGVVVSDSAETCESDPLFRPPFAEPAGGSWSASDSRVNINASNGEVTLNGSLPPGNYVLTYTEIAGDPNSCQGNFTLKVKAGPKLNSPVRPFCIALENPTGTINLSQSIDVTPKGGTWFNNGNENFITDANLGIIDLARLAGIGTYNVGYLVNGCPLQIPITFSGINAGTDKTVCENATSFVQTGQKPEDKFWFASDAQVRIHPTTGLIDLNRSLPAGTYEITYVERENDPNACRDQFVLTVLEAPKAEFDVPPYPSNQSYFYAQKETLNFASKFTGQGWNYSWSMGDEKTYNTPSVSHVYEKKGSYSITLKITHENGCEEEITHTLLIEEPLEFALPTVLTPNDDGFNDFLEVPFAPDYDIKISINDRFGNKVYVFPNDGNRWKPDTNIGSGTYFYVMELHNRVTGAKLLKSGNITILR